MEDILMTTKEAERLRLLKNHADGIVSLIQVSNLLNLSYRQTKRIWSKFKAHGEKAVISKKRTLRNRAMDPHLENNIISLIRERYHDYGPVLITEKLEEIHQINTSRETVRKLMIKHGLRKQKHIKKI